MARSSLLCLAVTLLYACVAQADISPTAQFIQTRPYMQLSTENPIGAITIDQIEKASGIVPSVADGLVAWADGRSGKATIMGFDLVNWTAGEFLISSETDDWQEGNPFVGLNAAGQRRNVYDAAEIGVGVGDLGDIQGSPATPPPAPTQWVYQGALLQRCPVIAVAPYVPEGDLRSFTTQGQYVAWIGHTGSQSQLFPSYDDTDIYTQLNPPLLTGVPGPQPVPVNITAGSLAPRDHLAASGRYLAWQELRMHDPMTEDSSWDVVVYDLGGGPVRYLDGPDAGKNQIAPDVCGSLVVWTQEEDPSGTGATNLYFQDLDSAAGPVTITSSGAATQAAIGSAMVNEGAGDFLTYFVVWQDHQQDGGNTSLYPGGNGEIDFLWDIWGQELRRDTGTGEWALYKDAFLIWRADGRQTRPDIDGLDVVWQSQATGTEFIYVWGPIPEPCTAALLIAGGSALVGLRSRGRRRRA